MPRDPSPLKKIENLSAIKKNDGFLSAVKPPPSSPSKAERPKSGVMILKIKSKSSGGSSRPAFQGAKFDKAGYCLKHPGCQLVKPMKDDDGKLVYQELKVSCPSCQSAKHKSNRKTSLGGGKVRSGHGMHGAAPSRSRSKSRERGSSGSEQRGRDNEKQLNRSSSARSASKSRERSTKSRREYDTPFDGKGRCHHHKNVQLAAKKMTGGWKMLHDICPKCMEDKFEAGDGGGDDRSVRSSSSRKSTRSGAGTCGGGGDAHGQFDKNGCCVLHTHIQVAKKRVFGTGFKVVRTCPACDGDDVGPDDMSVSSKKSTRSNSSRKSSRSSASRSKPGKAIKSSRYGALPFDGDGYCCRHPSMQLAKKKTLGGFKIIHDVCPECTLDDGGSRSSRRKPSRRKSQGTGRVFDDSGSETSSFKSGKSGISSGAGSSSGRRKRIRVRNLRTEDEEGKHGRYSGDVNDDHQPHGNGIMKYEDGTLYDGVWSEGSKVHGKTKSRRGSKSKF
mmetsp:Transcript_13855/g.30177  ORF Transcript_13855/g.30177 Transcript_13855/m.30177 type:complete len:501 (-) Transcript_13855:129-1631(-)